MAEKEIPMRFVNQDVMDRDLTKSGRPGRSNPVYDGVVEELAAGLSPVFSGRVPGRPDFSQQTAHAPLGLSVALGPFYFISDFQYTAYQSAACCALDLESCAFAFCWGGP